MERVKIVLVNLQSGGTQISGDLTFLLVVRGRVALKTPERQCTLEESEFSVLNCDEPFTISPLDGAKPYCGFVFPKIGWNFYALSLKMPIRLLFPAEYALIRSTV